MADLSEIPSTASQTRPIWKRPWFIVVAAIVVLNAITMSIGRWQRSRLQAPSGRLPNRV